MKHILSEVKKNPALYMKISKIASSKKISIEAAIKFLLLGVTTQR